jgi:hypothetical protein
MIINSISWKMFTLNVSSKASIKRDDLKLYYQVYYRVHFVNDAIMHNAGGHGEIIIREENHARHRFISMYHFEIRE